MKQKENVDLKIKTIYPNFEPIINMDNSKIENDASEIDITTKFEYVCSMCPSKFSNKSSLFEQFDSKHLKL